MHSPSQFSLDNLHGPTKRNIFLKEGIRGLSWLSTQLLILAQVMISQFQALHWQSGVCLGFSLSLSLSLSKEINIFKKQKKALEYLLSIVSKMEKEIEKAPVVLFLISYPWFPDRFSWLEYSCSGCSLQQIDGNDPSRTNIWLLLGSCFWLLTLFLWRKWSGINLGLKASS